MRPLRVLLSYHYFKDANVSAIREALLPFNVRVFADSGAYSAFTTGATIGLDEYAGWLRRWHECFEAAAALDVIGNPQASLAQTLELREKLDISCPLIPVYHATDGALSWLERYFAAGFDYVGIAPGPVRGDKKLFMAWLAQCFALRPTGTRYHGFAVTGFEAMRSFPWYSVDSTSWISSFRYARLILFNRARRKVETIHTRDPQQILKASALLAAYGLTAADVRADSYNMVKVVRACVESWQEIEAWLAASPAYQRATDIQDGARVYLGCGRRGEAGAIKHALEGNDVGRRFTNLAAPQVYPGCGLTSPSNVPTLAAALEPNARIYLGINQSKPASAESLAEPEGEARVYLGLSNTGSAPNGPPMLGKALKE